MRIVQCINALTLGGAQTYLLDLTKYLINTGNEALVIAFRDGLLYNEFKKLGVKIYIVGEIFFDLLGVKKISNIISNFEPHIVHSHLGKATFWMRLLKRFRIFSLLVSTIHGQEDNIFFSIEKKMYKFSDFLIFPSFYLANWYKNNIKNLFSKKFEVIYPGVKIIGYENNSEIKNINSKEYIVIGTLARLHPIKGVDVLIKASYLLIKRGYKIYLKVGGQGIDKKRLRDLAYELKIDQYISWLNEVLDNRSFYKDLDIYVCSSHQESFGISICEAMEAGVAVVASNVGGVPEIIKNGYNGYTFSDGNYLELADLLEFLILNREERNKISLNAKITVLQKFNREFSLNKHLEIYKTLYNSNSKNVCFAISSGEIGGGEKLAISLVSGLKERNWNVAVVCGKGKLEKKLASLNIVYKSASTNLGGFFWGIKLWAFCNKFKPNIINTHLNKASLIASILYKTDKFINSFFQLIFTKLFSKCLSFPKLNIHNCNKPYNPKILAHVHGMNDAIYYKYCDAIIAVSSQIYNHMISQGIESNKVFLLKNAIKSSNTKKVLLPSVNVVKENNPKTYIRNFGIIAKLHPNKGHKWILNTIASNKSLFVESKFYIIGTGPEENYLKQLVSSSKLDDLVVFTGFRYDIDSIYRILDVVVLPSYSEGIPLCLLEAMQYRLPIIATNVGGIPEIVIHEYNGYLINPEDSYSFIRAYTKIRDPANYRILSENAFKTFIEVNNFEKMLDKFEEILLKFLE